MTSRRNAARPLGWGYHILPDLESGKVKWSLARVNQVSKYFQCPPDYFLMGDEVAEEKTGMLRMLYTMEPEKRKSLPPDHLRLEHHGLQSHRGRF